MTPRERAAKAQIEAAIEEYRAAYAEAHPEATQGVLGDWIVVAAETKPDLEDEENDLTAYSIIMNGMPWYRSIGLLAAGKHYLTYNTGPQPDAEE